MLKQLTENPPPLKKLVIWQKVFMLGNTLKSTDNSTMYLRRLMELLNNMFKFLIFLKLGNTKLPEELSST